MGQACRRNNISEQVWSYCSGSSQNMAAPERGAAGTPSCSRAVSCGRFPEAAGRFAVACLRDSRQRGFLLHQGHRGRFICIYPAYLNNKKTIAEGRRIPIDKAVENPTSTEIQDVCAAVGFNVLLEVSRRICGSGDETKICVTMVQTRGEVEQFL
ncbi:signal recognition particle 19 kDa protein isoform X2 [Nyctibius grandis]|uniref:signal recognition particle 19 kDa protein isoform X2 n=1 Tax=Nyctibius grandis TaxID=48427 RepID=UPI0035BC3E15